METAIIDSEEKSDGSSYLQDCKTSSRVNGYLNRIYG